MVTSGFFFLWEGGGASSIPPWSKAMIKGNVKKKWQNVEI
jgi:hypothetical protein